MTLGEFLKNKFNLDTAQEIPVEETPVTSENPKTEQDSPISIIETDNDEISKLKEELENIKKENARLLERQPITDSSMTTEEKLYNLLIGGKNNAVKNESLNV